MALSPGTRVGPYEITTSIGAGGMGEVYRARDPRLNREVALKVLPEAFASDPERLARFEREAQTLAGLNHPNIAHIHGVEDSIAGRALVMEYVDGEDLRERLERGAIPLDEALAVARQIAEALEAAHERGIIHRDLKPANVKVAADGRVKVLDFGLAKALEGPGASQVDAMNSPTMTVRATAMGMIIGTAAYMAPEQAKGRSVDRRADVWAFGVVLYEMLSGRRAFEGADTSELLASVLRDSPPLDKLPAGTPSSIQRLLKRCLEKDPSKRLDSMAVARLEIEDALRADPSVPLSPSVPASTRHRSWLWAGLAGVLALMIAGLAWITTRPQSRDGVRSLRLSSDLGVAGFLDEGQSLTRSLAVSRDGRAIVFAARANEQARPQLYYRRLESLTATPLPGTDDAVEPFFAPKGDWVGFVSGGKLRKVAVAGGASVALADVTTPRGAYWGEDDVITYAPHATPGGKLMRIPAAAGTPAELGPFVEGHRTQRWPQALPGNAAVIYTGQTHVDQFNDACLVVHPLPAGPARQVECGGYAWRYVPSGHVLFIHRGTLFAKRFDPASLTTQGTATPVVEGIRAFPASGGADFSVSDDGTLVYVAGPQSEGTLPIEIIERSGKATRLPIDPQNWQSMAFSPDGRLLAIEVAASDQSDLWIYDESRDALTRLTFGDVMDALPVWTPDGRHIIFSSAKDGPPNLFSKAADGSGDEQRLLRSNTVQVPGELDPSGRHLLVAEQTTRSDFDISIVTRKSGSVLALDPASARKLVSTSANEAYGTVSPDSRWLAYASDESGQLQIYVRPFTGSGGRWQVSTNGGAWPRWTKTGELLYCTPLGEMMSVKYEVSAQTFRAGKPARWMEPRLLVRSLSSPYALHPDGTKIAGSTLTTRDDNRIRSFVLVTNLYEQLRAVPAR